VSARTSSGAVEAVMGRIFNIMALGLVFTGIASYITLHSKPILYFAVNNNMLLVIAHLALVFFISLKINSISKTTALYSFLGYSAMTGLVFSPIFLVYTHTSVVSAFFISAGMFGGMALWGLTTKQDLTTLGSLCVMGLWGVILASLVNFFMQSTAMALIISYAGVGVFIGLTAWDVQKFKRMASAGMMTENFAILGALNLYLDFINLFLFILNIVGRRR